MNTYKLISLLIVLLNIVAFAITGLDKSKAKRHGWRISEKTFLIVAVLGGSLGVLFGMYYFRHKTRHGIFVVGIPIILLLQIALTLFVSSKNFL